MIGKLLILIILSLFMAVAVMYFTEPKSEFHARVKYLMTGKAQKMINVKSTKTAKE